MLRILKAERERYKARLAAGREYEVLPTSCTGVAFKEEPILVSHFCDAERRSDASNCRASVAPSARASSGCAGMSSLHIHSQGTLSDNQSTAQCIPHEYCTAIGCKLSAPARVANVHPVPARTDRENGPAQTRVNPHAVSYEPLHLKHHRPLPTYIRACRRQTTHLYGQSSGHHSVRSFFLPRVCSCLSSPAPQQGRGACWSGTGMMPCSRDRQDSTLFCLTCPHQGSSPVESGLFDGPDRRTNIVDVEVAFNLSPACGWRLQSGRGGGRGRRVLIMPKEARMSVHCRCLRSGKCVEWIVASSDSAPVKRCSPVMQSITLYVNSRKLKHAVPEYAQSGGFRNTPSTGETADGVQCWRLRVGR